MLPTVDVAGDMRVPRIAVGHLVADVMKRAKEADLAITSKPMPALDLSGLSIEEVRRLAEMGSEAALSSTPAPATLPPKSPPNRGGRPKGLPSVRRSEDCEGTGAGAPRARAEGARGTVAPATPVRCNCLADLAGRRGGVINPEPEWGAVRRAVFPAVS